MQKNLIISLNYDQYDIIYKYTNDSLMDTDYRINLIIANMHSTAECSNNFLKSNCFIQSAAAHINR